MEEIAKLDGVDGLWLGHFDLSCSLGIPGEFENPKFLDAVERTAAAGKAAGIPVGRICGDVKEGLAEHAKGFDLIGISGDAWMLQAALGAAAADLRAGAK